MTGPDRGDSWAGVVTALVAGGLFFVGGIMVGLSVVVLLAILAITAVVTVGLFVLS
jgi:hypothetical protein